MPNFRTTDAKVKQVLEVSDSIKTTAFIEVANNLVTDYIVTECKASYSAAKLELIERWLAAHFYSVRDRRLSEEETGKTSGVYQGRTAMGFDSTLYGQHAKLLDTDGCLAALDATQGKRTVGATWVGTKPSDRVAGFSE